MVYPFLPIFGRGLGIELPAMSQAMAVRSATGALGPFLASVADTRGRKLGMLLGLALFVAATGLVLFFPTFPAFVASIVLMLLGYFAFNPSMQAYLGDRVAYQRRGQALALPELGWSLSLIIGVPLVGLLIARYSWQAPFYVLTGLGGLAFIVIMLVLPRDAARPPGQLGLWRMFGLVIACAPALAGLLMGLLSGMANELIVLVFGVWLESSFGLKIAALASAAALVGCAELMGELFSAGLVDRIGKARAVSVGLIMNSLAAIALAVIGTSLLGALAGLFLFFLSFEFVMVSSIPLMSEILPQARATLMATYVAIISLGRAIGDIVSPPLYALGQRQSHFSGLLAISAGVVLLNLFALLALRSLSARLPS